MSGDKGTERDADPDASVRIFPPGRSVLGFAGLAADVADRIPARRPELDDVLVRPLAAQSVERVDDAR